MKKSTIITIGLASIVLLASLILIIAVFLPKLSEAEKTDNLSKSLEDLVSNYYENEFSVMMPDFLEKNGSLTVTLDSLKAMNKDVKIFEEHNCNLLETYGEIKSDGDSFKVEVHLDCE